jgi:hypothetical protein
MKLWKAILLTLGIWVGSVLAYVLIHRNLMWYIVPATTLWAAIDSSQIQLRRYRNGVGPVAFFFLCLWWWIVGFPWYLWMRHKILTGTAELRTNDPRCVRCEELISPDVIDCPKCGWRQPK